MSPEDLIIFSLVESLKQIRELAVTNTRCQHCADIAQWADEAIKEVEE